MKMRLSLASAALVGLMAASVTPMSAQDKKDSKYPGAVRLSDEKGDEGAKIQVQEVKSLAAQPINTGEKPKPNDYYAVATYDVNGGSQNSGGFYLKKDTDEGQAIYHSFSRHVATSLKGYGSTTEYWVYEVVDAPLNGKKVFLAFSKVQNPNTAHAIYAITGNDAPAVLPFNSFFAYGIRGKRIGNMN